MVIVDQRSLGLSWCLMQVNRTELQKLTNKSGDALATLVFLLKL